MIYTVTLNPSLDYLVRTDALRPGALCRTHHETLYPGGKGVNVSLVCAALASLRDARARCSPPCLPKPAWNMISAVWNRV